MVFGETRQPLNLTQHLEKDGDSSIMVMALQLLLPVMEPLISTTEDIGIQKKRKQGQLLVFNIQHNYINNIQYD